MVSHTLLYCCVGEYISSVFKRIRDLVKVYPILSALSHFYCEYCMCCERLQKAEGSKAYFFVFILHPFKKETDRGDALHRRMCGLQNVIDQKDQYLTDVCRPRQMRECEAEGYGNQFNIEYCYKNDTVITVIYRMHWKTLRALPSEISMRSLMKQKSFY